MYSNEDLEIKCKSNTMKLASFVEMRAEAKARKLDQQLKYAQKNKFGDRK